jgi:broad specificity phosphatase PhoE
VTLQGGPRGLRDIDWQLQTRQAGYSNPEGSQAAEALRLTSQGRAVPKGQDWQVQASLAAPGGMLYSDPLYLEFSEAQPLELDAALRWYAAAGEVQLESFAFRQPGVTRGRAQGLVAPGAEQPLKRLSLSLDEAQLPGLYTTWLQPWLAGTVLEDLDTGGRLQGSVRIENNQPLSVRLALDEVSFGDRDGLFGLQALDGELVWDAAGQPHRSRLAWESAHFHQLVLGPAALQLEIARDAVRIREPLAVALLDGELRVEEFELGRDAGGEPRWLLDATLTPVSMQAFSAALGWPTMAGTLSGMVPRVRYEDGELTVGGTLLVQAFDGAVTVRDLRIRQPLGLVPRLWADARLDGLDLKTLTRTFSFGRIEGRLQGEVEDLYMEAWQLVAFDAHFETPPDDDSRHRISQRAVDNISNLGGAGVGGALSRGFLSVFEDFPYKRLGIRCRLEDGVCHMGGVAPAETGYYLVQGTWLPPRLDVIGYAEKVAWQSLVDRLVAVTRGETPRIQ